MRLDLDEDAVGPGQGRTADDLADRLTAYAYLCVAILTAALAVWVGS